MKNHYTHFYTFITSLAAFTAVTNTILFILSLLPFISSYLTPFLFIQLQLWFLAAGALFAIVFLFFKKNISEKWKERIPVIVRYWLAFAISIYGFSKIFSQQLNHSYYIDDMIWRQMSGFELTWSYFSHAYPFVVIIGLIQIVGSVLLLFRRTVLLGCFILLPVMTTIVLINIFYAIPQGALLNALLYTLGLLYLLFLHGPQLRKLFFSEDVSTSKRSFKNIFPVLLIIIPAFLIPFLTWKHEVRTKLSGNWKIDTLSRNGKPVSPGNWTYDSEDWQHAYIENYGILILSPNPYQYDADRSTWTQYSFDESKGKLTLILPDNDTLSLKVSWNRNDTMQWSGTYHHDTLHISLSKTRH